MCRAAAYARAGHVTARQFCDWLERSARLSQGRLAMPQSQRVRMCAATKKGARGQIRMQFSSFSQLDRSDNQTSMLKGSLPSQRARGHGKMEGAVIEGRKSRLWFYEVFICHGGVSAAARSSRGIRWVGSCGLEGRRAKRRRMRAQQLRVCWEGEGRWKRQLGEGAALLYSSKAAAVPCTCVARRQGEHHD